MDTQREPSGTETAGRRRSDRCYFELVQQANDAIFVLDERGIIIEANLLAESILGATSAALAGQSFLDFVSRRAAAVVRPWLSRLATERTGRLPEVRLSGGAAHRRWVELSGSFVDSRRQRAVVIVARDVSEQKSTSERLAREAMHDALTGLPNRSLFMDRLHLAVERTKRRPERRFAVLFLDLDRFKYINDSLGHAVGDELLVGMAQRLGHCIRATDTAARLGGDEFTVLVDDIRNEAEARIVAERIGEALKPPFVLAGRDVYASASIGIAMNLDSADAVAMLRDADTAMYHAKAEADTPYQMFRPSMHAKVTERLELETELRHAIERQEFCTVYQPIVELASGTIVGLEALVRWNHPARGRLTPIAFLRAADEAGLIGEIDRWVLGQACAHLRQWQTRWPEAARWAIGVNVSTKRLAQPSFTRDVEQVLADTGLAPTSLRLELTEDGVIDRVEEIEQLLSTLSEKGVRLSLDDFGTGYSSLSYLHRFSVDTLKIDRSFIATMCDEAGKAEIVRAILALGANLGLDVVAEGIETRAQVDRLLSLGCPHGQGYRFAGPVDPEQIESLVVAPPWRNGS